MSITTKTGDHGETSLLTGERVKKSGLRVDTYGTLDEVDSALGLARAFSDKDDVAERILKLQRKMPALMADFASCGKEPRIKRMKEVLGDSYFNHLANLPDLVLLMDESHRYRASAGVRAINELKPLFGLEVTATPFVESSKGPVPFKNVVMDYPLARAMEDGFVKEPAVVTQRNFDAKAHTPEEIEKTKLEDGVRLHETTKVELLAWVTAVVYLEPGLLAKQVSTRGMDAGALGGMLGQQRAEVQQQGGLGGGLMNAVLDTDGDGKVDLSDLREKQARQSTDVGAPGILDLRRVRTVLQ